MIKPKSGITEMREEKGVLNAAIELHELKKEILQSLEKYRLHHAKNHINVLLQLNLTLATIAVGSFTLLFNGFLEVEKYSFFSGLFILIVLIIYSGHSLLSTIEKNDEAIISNYEGVKKINAVLNTYKKMVETGINDDELEEKERAAHTINEEEPLQNEVPEKDYTVVIIKNAYTASLLLLALSIFSPLLPV